MAAILTSPKTFMGAAVIDISASAGWNTETGNVYRIMEVHSNLVTSVIISKDSKFVISASDDHTVVI